MLAKSARQLSSSFQQLHQAKRWLASTSAVHNPRQRRAAQPSFGNYQRIVPTTLVPRKPAPKEPSPLLVPRRIPRPSYARTGEPPSWPTETPILTAAEIPLLREASRIARDALALGGRLVAPGMTTAEIDRRVHQFIVSQDAYPSCLNYMGFPRSICTSVNNIIAHGIPDARPLMDGDMVNLDVTVFKDGFHGDNSAMFAVGQVDRAGEELMRATREALALAIELCGPGVPLRCIGDAIATCAVEAGLGVSEELTGHGVGRCFHQNPLVYHHFNEEPGVMLPGMAFTVEPILCQGSARGVMWPDGWTVATEDGGRSAQYEHTLLITQDGVEVMTASR